MDEIEDKYLPYRIAVEFKCGGNETRKVMVDRLVNEHPLGKRVKITMESKVFDLGNDRIEYRVNIVYEGFGDGEKAKRLIGDILEKSAATDRFVYGHSISGF